jgi:aspartyl-tRNA(Asn)/glutamyl-tRNA(Gln) amidotransferase subunit A
MRAVDVVITAGAPNEAPKMDGVPRWDVFAAPSFTMPFNVSGYPAIAVCTGFGPGGLPVSMQIAGKPFQEATVFQIADAFEKATAFRGKRPAMVA